MEKNRPRLSDRTMQPASAGLGSDFKRLRSNGAATLAELREFLGGMRGRSPQQVLGEVANSSLVTSLVWCTVGTIALFVVGTLVPYYLRGPEAPKPAKPETPAVAAPAKSNEPAGDAKKTADAAAPSEQPQDPALVNAQKAAEKMQMNETKQADPKSNPLDKDLDKLLEVK